MIARLVECAERKEDLENHFRSVLSPLISKLKKGQTFTLTFGDVAENHVGNQQLGEMSERGFSVGDLAAARARFEAKGVTCDWIDFNEVRTDTNPREPAVMLIIRGGLNAFLRQDDADGFFLEQWMLEKDARVKMYGRVVNKHARHNLCFDENDQAPDYENGKGTVVAFERVPLLNEVRHALPEWLGESARGLKAEGNYYFDIEKCGIGWHGDGERRKVVGVRVGETMSFHARWYHQSEIVSPTVKVRLAHGDVYILSEKAVGTDWKSRKAWTLRHAAGSAKFLDEASDQ